MYLGRSGTQKYTAEIHDACTVAPQQPISYLCSRSATLQSGGRFGGNRAASGGTWPSHGSVGIAFSNCFGSRRPLELGCTLVIALDAHRRLGDVERGFSPAL
jgi:hypothetical protein